MPLNSIQLFCQGIAASAVLPSAVSAPLVAYVTPPPVEKISGPRVYVWGGKVRESRQSGSRIQGFKKLPWSVDLWCSYMDTPDNAMANEPFPQFIDAVMAAFRAAPMSVFIDGAGNVINEDAADASCSQLQQVGETMELDYPPERATAQMRMLWFSARIGVDILEVILA